MRAFTLLEAMLALAISGIVVSSATVATVSIYQSLVAKQQQADADDQARAVADYLGSDIMKIGGDYVVPSTVVQSSCWSTTTGACEGDVLRYVELASGLPQVEITAVAPSASSVPASSRASAPVLPTSLTVRPFRTCSDVCTTGQKACGNACIGATSACSQPAGTACNAADYCPMAQFGTNPIDVVLLPVPSASSVPPVPAMGAGWLAGRCTPVATSPSATGQSVSGCGCTSFSALTSVTTTTTTPVGAPSAQSAPTASATAAFPYPNPGVAGWLLVAGQGVTVWHDVANKTLYEARDFDNSGKYTPRVLSNAVWKFRAQFGFEGSVDGYLGAWTTTPDATKAADLRGVRIGVIAGARSSSRTTPSSARTFVEDAAPLSASEPTGVLLRAASTTVMLRNTLVY